MRKSGRYADLSELVLRSASGLGAVRLVAIDGPAGSGKTTFAGRLAEHLRAAGAETELVHVDDLLDGWVDLVTFWPRLEEWVLQPLRTGRPGRFRRYDWHRGRFGDEWHVVGVPDVLIVEGVTSARAEVRDQLAVAVAVVAPEALRLKRVIDRDGAGVRADLLRWMAMEQEYFLEDNTMAKVDLVIDGAPGLPHDPAREYVVLSGDA